MKNFTKETRFSKVLAALLSVVMVISTIMTTPFSTVKAASTAFTITVTDKFTSEPIADAEVMYWLDSDYDTNLTANTDENGIAQLDEVTKKFTDGATSVELLYQINKDGYEVYFNEQEPVTDAQGNIAVQMKESVAPEITKAEKDIEEWTKDDITITVSATDNNSGVAEYSTDKTTWQTSAEFTISANGTYAFYAKDNAGNISDAYEVEVTNIDKTAPVISSVTVTPDTWTKEIVTLEVTATDTGCGILAYKMDDSAWQTMNIFEVSDDATHKFYVKDVLGNESEAYVAAADKFDNTAPTITAIIPEDGWSNESITFTVEATDNKSRVAYYSVDDNSENAEWKKEATFDIKDTDKHVFYVKDNAGNISEGVEAEIAKIEKDKPVISGVTLSTEDWTNAPVTFTVTASDEEGGSGIATYKMDNGEWQDVNTFEVSDDKEHKFYVKDNAGNVSEAYSKKADNYDDVAPTIKDIDTESKGWMNKTVIITVSAADNKSTILYYSMDDDSDDAEWQTSNEFKIKDKNEHTFYVKDQAGNISSDKDAYTEFDAKAPDLNNVTLSQDNVNVFAKTLNFLTFGLFFNKTLNITIDAKDEGDNTNAASGIAQYIIRFYDENNILIKEKSEANETFVIDYSEVENFQGTITVEIIDNAGVSTGEIQLTTTNSNLGDFEQFMIENDAPVISGVAAYDNAIYSNNFSFEFHVSDVQDSKKYSGIAYIRVSVNGKEVYLQCENGEVQKSEGNYSLAVDMDKNTVNGQIINEWKDGVLTFTVEAYDNAGNVAEKQDATIYVDQTAPVISGFKFSLSDNIDVNGSDDGVYKAVDATDYGFYFKEKVEVTITAEDVVGENETKAAGVKYITYKAVNVDGETQYEGNNKDNDDKTVASFEIDADFKGQIYAFATDNKDNGDDDDFVHPNSSVLETATKHEETSSIEITAPETTMTQNEVESYQYEGVGQEDKEKAYDTTKQVPLYNEAQTFEIAVTDTYSGIRSISVTVIENNGVKISDTLEVTNAGDKVGDAAEVWTVNKDENSNLVYTATRKITIDGAYNDMILLVELTDRAGNVSYDYYMFGIDKSAPVVTVEMNDDDNDAYDGFFNVDRVATITVQERNFINENVVFTVTVTDENGVKKDIEITPDFAVETDENGNPKATAYAGEGISGEYYTYIMNYTFVDDGDYTFDIKVTDLAEQENTSVSYANAKGEDIEKISTAFTIDKKLPIVSVVYDNTAAANGNYYKADRTATITIAEHNFVASDVVIIGTATDNGVATTFPAASAWKDNGNNTYTATISYTADSKYTFDIEYVDKAGNSISDYAVEEFYVDKTKPTISITGVTDKSANNGTVAPVISYSDTNIELSSVSITLEGINNGKVDYKYSVKDITNGETRTYVNFEEIQKVDDIYTLTISLRDMAGNPDSKTITFSVNRFGSVYDLTAVKDIIGKYLQNEQDIVFTETNVDTLDREGIQIKLTKNGTPTELVEGEDYTVAVSGGNGQWSKYTYTISKELFADDGTYSISVYSVDASGNVNENIDESKEAEISFGIDKTKPVIVPVDFESGVQYHVEKKEVSIEIKDNLVLDNVKILLNDKEVEYTVSGDTYTFVIPEADEEQNVKVIVTDAAGNEYTLLVEDFLVTTNVFVQWYYNTPLFVGSIIGAVLLIGGFIFFILFKKKKEDEEEK